MDRKDEGTRDDQERGGGTNFILRIKEQDNTPNPSGTWWWWWWWWWWIPYTIRVNTLAPGLEGTCLPETMVSFYFIVRYQTQSYDRANRSDIVPILVKWCLCQSINIYMSSFIIHILIISIHLRTFYLKFWTLVILYTQPFRLFTYISTISFRWCKRRHACDSWPGLRED